VPKPVAISLNLTAGGLSFNDLPLLWPQPMAVNPRNWVTQHLRDGSIQQAQMNLTAQIDPASNSVPAPKTQGTIERAGCNGGLFSPLPPIEKGRWHRQLYRNGHGYHPDQWATGGQPF
jgi:hypothetical protein